MIFYWFFSHCVSNKLIKFKLIKFGDSWQSHIQADTFKVLKNCLHETMKLFLKKSITTDTVKKIAEPKNS